MASYLSYFTSTTASSAPPTSHGSSTTNSTSTWSSTFSSRFANLRKALTKDSEDDDPDNEDCSHISNVLRAYYAEKGRPLPEWLPPDPKRPVVAPQPQVSYGQYGNAYGSQPFNEQPHSRGSSGGRGGGLSDLWDPSPASAAPPSQSLRAPRPTPQSLRSNDSSRSQSSGGGQQTSFSGPTPTARPLPSQRAGSYQTNPTANAQALGSRDRLRARLQGGGSGRNIPATVGGGQPSYGPSGGNLSTQDRSGSTQPYISASQPWSTGGDGYGYDASSTNAGLPSSPYGNQDQRRRPGGPR
ncbi:hypothetical protein LTR20_001196 [Exophiala xenobiotica]|nr:hypothetical protein LTS13_005473 [Exophiala xenobiotica]KAK5397055.1 hypothetical protein LTR79_005692 [Exophiala xenobiotica]KAK5415327.1 hypothetical protein LTR90_006376 [Exophiala xenobiotica]KAK5470934.1 hypothetical protein LTR20_001196 [Exophiala xenobiotica]KAK5478386.1 hypothetical protein LTR26_007895 [Exophiala xenobiotica]